MMIINYRGQYFRTGNNRYDGHVAPEEAKRMGLHHGWRLSQRTPWEQWFAKLGNSTLWHHHIYNTFSVTVLIWC